MNGGNGGQDDDNETEDDKKAVATWMPQLPADLEEALEDLGEVLENARSPATRAAYDSCIRQWKTFAADHGLSTFPVSPQGLIVWLMQGRKEGKAFSTLRRRCAALSRWHEVRGEASPTADPQVREVLRGLSRVMKTAPTKKRALTADLVRAMVEVIDVSTPKGLRDRALVLVGFGTGMRRSELAALRWEHVQLDSEGVALFIAESKTDQEGEGVWIGVPRMYALGDLCPVVALRAWRDATDPVDGATVFQCAPKTVARVVKRYLDRIGEDADEFGAHSFRSGYITEARRSGASLDDIMAQTRHTSERVARSYIQRVDALRNDATVRALSRLRPEEDEDGDGDGE